MTRRHRERQYRRAPHLMVHWCKDQLIAENYADSRRTIVSPRVLEILARCSTPQTARSLAGKYSIPQGTLQLVLDHLTDVGLLRASHEQASRHDAMCALWDDWNPAARFFHTVTKDVRYGSTENGNRFTRARLRQTPRPSLTKQIEGREVELELPSTSGEFVSVLLRRRTWRAFGRRPVNARSLSTLLSLTSGVHAWTEGEVEGRVALKTSPSGGARHPIETYLAALRCSGLQRGLYHYAADRHALIRIGDVSSARMKAFLPQQPHFAKAGAVVFFTAVVARTMWRYPHARAYRALLIEAGHVCQTFCLTATWLGLAPFCTMALADSAIERALGIDGASEIVLYAAGTGTRPSGATWQPRPDGKRCHIESITEQ